MKRIILDTNVLIPFLRNPDDFADSLIDYDRIIVTPTVAGEYLAGIWPTKQGEENRRVFEDFLMNPAVDTLPITMQTGAIYARLYKELKRQGTPVPTNDIWIAASAIANDADVFSRDLHFMNIPGINLVK